MPPARIVLPTRDITDEDSFHRICAGVMGFPNFYGKNFNAWIDCMSYIDEPSAGMSLHHVGRGDLFHLEIADAEDFARRCPELLQAVIECTAFVNRRRTDHGEPPILALVFT